MSITDAKGMTSLKDSIKECDGLPLMDFAIDCQLPQTVQIVEGYESLESEELSWSQGEIINLHFLLEQTLVIAQDEKCNDFAIPLTYPGRIFDAIPKNRGKVSSSAPGNTKKSKLRTLREIIDGSRLPMSVVIPRGEMEALNGNNKTPSVKLEGLFHLREAVKQKTFLVSSLIGSQLRVLKLPMDVEISVRPEKIKLSPAMFSHISEIIEKEVKIESTIIRGSKGDVSWFFDLDEDIAIDEDFYAEILPPVPPRQPFESDSNPENVSRSKELDVRYAPCPGQSFKPKISPKPPLKSGLNERQPPPLDPKPKALPRSNSREREDTLSEDYECIDDEISSSEDGYYEDEYCEIAEVATNIQRDMEDESGMKVIDEEGPETAEASGKSDPVSPRNSGSNSRPTEERQQTADEIRERLQDMSVSDVSEYLKKLGLNKYVESFKEEMIDGCMLMELDDEMLEQLDVQKLHRKKLLMFIKNGYTPRL